MKRIVVAAVACALASASASAAGAAPVCATPVFAVGSPLPEPGASRVVARIFTLASGAGSMRRAAGTIYETASGATFYLSETGDVVPSVRATEIAFLEAAGYSPQQAQQYTHLREIPAVPPVAHPFDLARRLHLSVNRC